MRHSVERSGLAFGLRPIAPDDAAAIVELRTDPARSRYINPISPDVETQRRWIDAYLNREGDWYFAIVRKHDGRTEGFVGVYDHNPSTRRAEWGRWILRATSMAAAESVKLVYEVAFDVLGLDEVFCRTVADNTKVVSFHDACGLERAAILERAFQPDGADAGLDVIEHRLSRDRWLTMRGDLSRRAELVAIMLHKKGGR